MRKKAIAKADALRAVTEKSKPLIQSLVCQKGLEILQHEYFKTVLAVLNKLQTLWIVRISIKSYQNANRVHIWIK